MTQKEQRAIALGAVRSLLREWGMAPETVEATEAFRCVDELARRHPDTITSGWYANATDEQYRLFMREWRRWQEDYTLLGEGVRMDGRR